MKISIIIPIYNAKEYISNCIESIINQNIDVEKYEIILVNDGSTDGTKEVIDNIIKNNPNINIIYYEQINQGVSVARNNGVNISSGQYILFVDSDDILANNFLPEIYNCINNEDVIKFCIECVDQKEYNGRFELPFFNNLNGSEALLKFCESNNIFATPWGYLIKRDYIIKEHLFFEKNKFHEDYGYIPKLIFGANSVSSINLLGYKYIKRINSMVTDKNIDAETTRINDFLFHTESLIYFFLTSEKDIQKRKKIINYFFNRLETKINNLNIAVKENPKFDRERLKRIETIKEFNNKTPNSIDINKLPLIYLKNIYQVLFLAKMYFRNNLVNIILGGSAGKLNVIKDWSDLDFYIVLNDYNISQICDFRKEIDKCSLHIGTTFYTMSEVNGNCIDGKTKVMLYEQEKYNFNPILYGEKNYNPINYEEIIENDLMRFPNILHEFRRLHTDCTLDINLLNKKYVKKLLVLIKCFLNLHKIFVYGYSLCLQEFFDYFSNKNSEILTEIKKFDIIRCINEFEDNKNEFLLLGETILKCLEIEMEKNYGKANQFKRYNN